MYTTSHAIVPTFADRSCVARIWPQRRCYFAASVIARYFVRSAMSVDTADRELHGPAYARCSRHLDSIRLTDRHTHCQRVQLRSVDVQRRAIQRAEHCVVLQIILS